MLAPILLVSAEGRAGAATSSPCLTGRIGLSTHFFRTSEAEATDGLSTVSGAGVKWVREDFAWSLVEARKGTYDWSGDDALMTGAAKAGVNVLGILDYSPPWASSDPTGQGDPFYPPKNPADFAGYARQVIQRYGERGTFWQQHPALTPRPLQAVELWNEPFGSWFWKPTPDPAGYARLAHAAASAIKALQPKTKVLISGDPYQWHDGQTGEWLDKVLAADPGLARLVDAYSVHPYPDPRNLGPSETGADPRWAFSRVPLTYQIAARRGAARPVWITELGWSTADPVVGGVSEDQQAQFIRDAVLKTFTDWSFVERMFVYTWDKSSGTSSDWDGNLGLRRADGSPKPAWTSLAGLLAASPSSCPTSTTTSPTRPPRLHLRVAAKGMVTYELSEPASLRLRLQQRLRGLRSAPFAAPGRRRPCQEATPGRIHRFAASVTAELTRRGVAGRRLPHLVRRRLRHARCDLRAARGTVRWQSAAGRHVLAMRSALPNRRLRAGVYRIRLIAADSEGNRSRPHVRWVRLGAFRG